MARLTKLSKKQLGFANDYLDSGNATQSALKNYDVKNERSAASVGSQNLTNIDIRAYIASMSKDAASMVQQLSQFAENEAVRLSASKDILDRAGFKPVDKTEVKVEDNRDASERIKMLAERLRNID